MKSRQCVVHLIKQSFLEALKISSWISLGSGTNNYRRLTMTLFERGNDIILNQSPKAKNYLWCLEINHLLQSLTQRLLTYNKTTKASVHLNKHRNWEASKKGRDLCGRNLQLNLWYDLWRISEELRANYSKLLEFLFNYKKREGKCLQALACLVYVFSRFRLE